MVWLATHKCVHTHRWRLAAALALTALGCGASLASEMEPTSTLRRYRHAISAYRSEGVDGAKLRVKALDPAEAISAVTELQRRMNQADESRVNDWTSESLGVAVVVHLELYVETARDGTAAPWHLEVANILLGLHRAAAGEPKFRRQAAVALAWLLQIAGGFDLLRAHLSISLKEFPEEPTLLVAQAVLYEAAASPRFRERNATTAVTGLNMAARAYRRVLALDPTSAEVRARFGFVLIRLNRGEEARAQLELALSGADSPRSIYLAALLLGRSFESAGNLERATESYRHAHEAAPLCQIAALALSNTLTLLGDREAAVAVASRAASVGPDKCDDPWWSYDYGQAWRLEGTLTALRGDAVR
jgi:tetratricopeptide (TPR) repeat protein